MNKERLATFSDGVFAIAITLLVLSIDQPALNNYGHLASQLRDRWPSLAAYVVSFAVIGIMWVNHHTVFSHLARVDRGMYYLNLLLLMTIVFIPYPTEVFGQALSQAKGSKTAAIFYSATMAVNALAWASLWLYASTGRRLLKDEFPESDRSMSTLLFAAGSAVYCMAIALALVNPYLCLSAQGALGIYYAFDPISQWTERKLELSDKDTSASRKSRNAEFEGEHSSGESAGEMDE